MRPIHVAFLDKPRPVVILTRELLVGRTSTVTIAPITSRIRGLSTEVLVGPANGLDSPSVISCDDVTTIEFSSLGELVGYLLPHQEQSLAKAVSIAFDLTLID